MWTIWHIAFTHRHGLGTLASAFSKPLSEPHGKQESEHGNDPGRNSLLLLDVSSPAHAATHAPAAAAAVPATAGSTAAAATAAAAPGSGGAATADGPAAARGAAATAVAAHADQAGRVRLVASNALRLTGDASSASPNGAVRAHLARADDLLSNCTELLSCCGATSLSVVGYDGRAVAPPAAPSQVPEQLDDTIGHHRHHRRHARRAI
eukprot:1774094-Prymnesium_polylepis.1